MSALRVKGIAKSFGAFAAVRPTDLEISSGEFFAILGPRGCGKTSSARILARSLNCVNGPTPDPRRQWSTSR